MLRRKNPLTAVGERPDSPAEPLQAARGCKMSDLKPSRRPARPNFSSGPCAKHPGWSASSLPTASLGRSHRNAFGQSRVKEALDRTRAVLEIPQTHRLAIVPASDTGAMETAMWSLLGSRPVDVLVYESFGATWATDAVKQLKLDARLIKSEYGELPDVSSVDEKRDLVFVWNGTTSGVRIPDASWISERREGVTICDATSAAFAMPLDWDKLDATTFSWQKALGGEGGHGVIVLGPRAVERLLSYRPPWPMPKIFRLTKDGALIEDIFEGLTINTPSLLCVEDYIGALNWAASLGGLAALYARVEANASALGRWVENTAWIDYLCRTPACRSNTSVCLKIVDRRFAALDAGARRAFVKKMAAIVEAERVAYDVVGHRDAPPGLRIWCGPTVDTSDVEALGPWLDWAFRQTLAELL
jgi:phosphoserine aminotransferase